LSGNGKENGVAMRSQLAAALGNLDASLMEKHVKDFHDRHENSFFRWHIIDKHGILRAEEGENQEMHQPGSTVLLNNEDKPLAFRGWFNGDVDHYDRQHERFPPLTTPYISHPYFGKQTNTGVICFSTPIVDPENAEVAGVLGALVTVRDLASWVSNVKITHGCVALINERGFCVYHPDPEDPEKPLQPKPNKLPELMHGAEVEQILARAREHSGEGPSPEFTTAAYRDSIDGKTYLAAMKVLPRSKWVAIVQHELKAVDEPVYAMQGVLSRGRWATLGTSLALMLGLWGCLFSWLRRDDKVSHA
jgi:hypothetical protein